MISRIFPKDVIQRKILTLIIIFILSFISTYIGLLIRGSLAKQFYEQINNTFSHVHIGTLISRNLNSVEKHITKLQTIKTEQQLINISDKVLIDLEQINLFVTVLREGGYVADKLSVNFMQSDEVEATYKYTPPKTGYNLDIIELGPSVINIKSAISRITKKKAIILKTSDQILKKKMETKINLLTKQVTANLGRALENTNKILYDSQQTYINNKKKREDFVKRFNLYSFLFYLSSIIILLLFTINIMKQIYLLLAERETNQQKIENLNMENNQVIEVAGPACIINNDKIVYRANDSFCNFFHKPKEEIIGMKCHDIFNCSFNSTNQCLLDKCKNSATKKIHLTHNGIIQHDDHISYVQIDAYALHDSQGNMTGIVETILDITDRKKVEEKYRNLFTYSQDAIMMLSPPDWKFSDANQQALKIFGVKTLTEFISLGPADFAPEYQPDNKLSSKMAKQHILHALKNGYNSFEWIHKRLNGEEFPATVLLSNIQINDQTILQATVRDISEMKKNEKERLILQKELNHAQKLESIGTLAAGVAHEINTPIQFIANNTGFIKKATEKLLTLVSEYRSLLSQCSPGEDTNKTIEEAKKMEKQAKFSFFKAEIPRALSQSEEGLERVTNIVKAMKDFSHMGNEEMSLEDINKAIESTITISKNEWKYVAELNTDLDPNLPMVNCFVGDIKQVILNLVVNASHAIKDALEDSKEKMGTITIRTYTENSSIFIKISDTGTGIPETARDKVFDHFFTTKEVGKGTGQGLSMAYQTIVEKHKGNISFETEMGKGTTFIIQLPV